MLLPLWPADRIRDIPMMVCTLLAINVTVFLVTLDCAPHAIQKMALFPSPALRATRLRRRKRPSMSVRRSTCGPAC